MGSVPRPRRRSSSRSRRIRATSGIASRWPARISGSVRTERQAFGGRGGPANAVGRFAAADDDLLLEGLPVFPLVQSLLGAELREQGVHELAETGPGRAMGEGALVLDGPGDQRNQERHLRRRQVSRFPAEIGAGGGPKAVEIRAPLDDVQVDLEDAILAEGRFQK